jgi:hypothetical protein
LDKDRLINLLPEEYLPEPEFKGFPIFAAVLIILTLVLVGLQYQRDYTTNLNLKQELNRITLENADKMEQVAEFTEIQANARFIRSYAAVVPKMILQAPDYWEVYNEIERLLPEDTWVSKITFRPAGKKWPDVIIDCISRGYNFKGPLDTFDNMKGTTEDPTRFRNIRMAGYQLTNVGGNPAAVFSIQMEIRVSK